MSTERTKLENRIMGEYSIAKSYKGILRIAHIIDLIQGEPDTFLNPTYYGTPSAKVNINLTSQNSKQKGTPTAEHSLKGDGSVKRYISDDPLKNKRVPMTDSMGNYLNWNVGIQGVTIGSNEAINGNSHEYKIVYQNGYKFYPIYQERYFPIYETSQIFIGRNNKQHRDDKKSNVNASTLVIEASEKEAQLIIENLYEKENYISEETVYEDQGKTRPVILKQYNPVVGTDKKYKKLRTIYHNSKKSIEDYDMLMYQQNDFDVNNYYVKNGIYQIDNSEAFDLSKGYNSKLESYNQGDILDCHVNFTNFKQYIKKSIQKYLNGNIVEVPSGTVIWQYASLDKWRAYDEAGDGDDCTPTSYPGNRPILEMRTLTGKTENTDEGTPNVQTPFFANTLQGACRKQNRLKGKGNNEDTIEDASDPMKLEDDNSYLSEIIPLYKRDYLLCDGSNYKIMFFPETGSSDLNANRESFDRFFKLFFSIGYKYTPKEKLFNRPRYKKHVDSDGVTRYYITNQYGAMIINTSQYNRKLQELGNAPSVLIKDFKEKWAKLENVSVGIIDQFKYIDNQHEGWKQQGAPAWIYQVQDNNVFGNCPDTDILFQEDLASMLSINILYDYVKSYFKTNDKYPTKSQLDDFCTDSTFAEQRKFPQKYIFNSFIGHPKGISVPFKTNERDKNGETKIVSINIGREVNSMNSPILFYDSQDKKVIDTLKVYQLPVVQFFIQFLSSAHSLDPWILQYCYSFLNYDFCVPNMLPDDDTPAFIGSAGYLECDEEKQKVKKVMQWKSKYNHASIPHRHAVFGGKSILDDLNTTTYDGQTLCKDPESFSGSHYNMGEIGPYSLEVPNIATYYAGSLHDYTKYPNKGGWGKKDNPKWKTDGQPNYIINQYHVDMEEINVNGVPTRIMQRDPLNDEIPLKITNPQIPDGKIGRPYGWTTGGYRYLLTEELVQSSTQTEEEKQNQSIETQLRPKYDMPGAYVSHETLGLAAPGENENPDDYEIPLKDISEKQRYVNNHSRAWYSLLPFEDPRFDTAEPNRGLTSQPIPFTNHIDISYEKINDNRKAYASSKNKAACGFFSPEHITMLPLIKL